MLDWDRTIISKITINDLDTALKNSIDNDDNASDGTYKADKQTVETALTGYVNNDDAINSVPEDIAEPPNYPTAANEPGSTQECKHRMRTK